MKFLLVLAVVFLGVWLWKSGRAKPPESARPARHQPLPPQEMLACSFCKVHVPAPDALRGRDGVYCCADHQQRAET
jgi:uncharacterized protein